jgi:hypothetical protein
LAELLGLGEHDLDFQVAEFLVTWTGAVLV